MDFHCSLSVDNRARFTLELTIVDATFDRFRFTASPAALFASLTELIVV